MVKKTFSHSPQVQSPHWPAETALPAQCPFRRRQLVSRLLARKTNWLHSLAELALPGWAWPATPTQVGWSECQAVRARNLVPWDWPELVQDGGPRGRQTHTRSTVVAKKVRAGDSQCYSAATLAQETPPASSEQTPAPKAHTVGRPCCAPLSLRRWPAKLDPQPFCPTISKELQDEEWQLSATDEHLFPLASQLDSVGRFSSVSQFCRLFSRHRPTAVVLSHQLALGELSAAVSSLYMSAVSQSTGVPSRP